MMNKKFFLTFCVVSISLSSVIAQELKPFEEGDRIAFVGNSITHAGYYESYIWLYYMTHFPNREVTVLNGGAGAEVVGQMSDRFEDDILRMRPNKVVLTFGMNDSGYFEFWKDDADKTANERIEKSYNSFMDFSKKLKAHPEITPIMMSTSPYDETAKIEANNFAGKSKTIEHIVAFQQQHAKENNWAYVDVYNPMLELTKNQQKIDSTYTITGPDRIHPRKAGHLVIASIFLKNQGLAGQPVANIEIDVKNEQINKSENAKTAINTIRKDYLSFEYKADALPFPIDFSTEWGNSHKQADALDVYPFTKEFNQEIIQVDNLETGNYELKIDGKIIAEFSKEELSTGVNMALLSNTPQYKQAMNVMFLNEQRAEIEGKLREYYWAQFNYFMKKDMLFEDSQKAYDMASTEKEGFVGSKMGVYRTARFPEVRQLWEENMNVLVNKIYEINKPKKHTIELVKTPK